MSQLRRAGSPSIGKPSIHLGWSDFVQIVLQLTVQAYQAMYRDKIVQKHWEENVFTERLGEDYLRPIAFDNESSLRIEIRSKVHTDEMRQGIQGTIQAKEMDLSMYGVWERDYRNKRFVWEAKRIGDKRVDSSFSNLNSEYVNEAIYRFIQGEYALDLNDAGVLGYVLAGDAEIIKNDINLSMGRLRVNPILPPSNHLDKATPINGFKNIYTSQHTRTDRTTIQLHHLFLTFDYT